MSGRAWLVAVLVVVAVGAGAAWSFIATPRAATMTVTLESSTKSDYPWEQGLPCSTNSSDAPNCAERCAETFTMASKAAHEYWERAATVRRTAFFVAAASAALAAGFVVWLMRRARRLWPGWLVAVAAFAAASLASAASICVAEHTIGDPDGLRRASSALLRLRDLGVLAKEAGALGCVAPLTVANGDPNLERATAYSDYVGLAARLPKHEDQPDKGALSDVFKAKVKDVRQVAGEVPSLERWRSAEAPPQSEPEVYAVLPPLLAGAAADHAWFFPTWLGSAHGWGLALWLQALTEALVAWGLCLLDLFVRRIRQRRHLSSV